MNITRLITYCVTHAIFCILALADWKVHPASEFDSEVRVWASAKERDLDFSWSGKVNARHEAEGYGILEWFRSTPDGKETMVTYTGEMSSGRRHGMGVAVYHSGAKYSGQWSDNVKAGKGDYWYSNGDFYVGSFQNDLMHGPGRYTSTDGTVFEGTFVSDERDGPGVVIYPDGRRSTSTWSAGKVTSHSGGEGPTKPYMVLGVDLQPYALARKTATAPIMTYLGRFMDGDFVIDPDWWYWHVWSEGGPVVTNEEMALATEGVFPVALDVRIFNPTKEKLEIRHAEVVVEQSFVDREPILMLRDGSSGGGVTCVLENLSANHVEDCQVAFNIQPPDAEPRFDRFQFEEKIEPFYQRGMLSLARAMKTLGMDADAVAALEKGGIDQEAFLRRMQNGGLGPFSKFAKSWSAYSLIAAEVRITWTDHLGAKKTKRVKFHFKKCLYLFAEMSAGEAPSGKYDLLLKNEGKDYVVPFNYKRTIAPGGNSRFTLQVASDVSTYQNFRIRLATARGQEIISPRCRMHFLVPRKFSWEKGYVVEEP